MELTSEHLPLYSFYGVQNISGFVYGVQKHSSFFVELRVILKTVRVRDNCVIKEHQQRLLLPSSIERVVTVDSQSIILHPSSSLLTLISSYLSSVEN